MHELLLFGQIPASRHDQVLNIFAGISAMQPVPVLENHLVFKPNRSSGSSRAVQVGAAQDIQKSQVQALQAQAQGDLFYMQLVADVSDTALQKRDKEKSDVIMSDHGEKLPTEVSNLPSSLPSIRLTSHKDGMRIMQLSALERKNPAGNPNKWTLQFRDLPEVARQRAVTSRLMADMPIMAGNPIEFMSALDYTCVPLFLLDQTAAKAFHRHTSTYFLAGHRFTHLSTSLLLYRLYLPSDSDEQGFNPSHVDISQARLLDPSGTYILQASVRVQDGSKVETMNKGVNELVTLRDTLKGVVELEIGDRLALDTRVR